MRQVIYAWNYLEWGGAQIHLLALIKEVRKEFDVKVVLPEGSNEQFIKFLDEFDVPYEFFRGHVIIKPAVGFKEKLEKHWKKIRSEIAMIRYLRKFNLSENVLHVDLSPQQSLLALIWLSLQTRVFITSHNSLPPVSKWRYALWNAKLKTISKFKNFNVFCSNKEARDYFKNLYSAELAEKIKVTYTSVNPEEIDAALAAELDRDELCRKYNLPNDKFLVFCVGQFIDRKGRWIFMEAARQVAEKDDSIEFVWISNSKPTDEDLKQAESYGLAEKFHLITSDQIGKERIDLFKIMRLADAFTLPSYVEGLPISLLEAMALGIPSISTNVNAIPEAVINNETGILIEAGDHKALAEAILKLKTDENLRKKLSKKGREYVLEHFDERVVARIALESYKKSLNGLR